MTRLRLALGVAITFAVGFVLGCGADDLVAPAAEKKADIRQCRSFEQLMPNFVAALKQGKTENLRQFVEKELLKPERQGEPPPLNDVLRAIFKLLTQFSTQAPEVGAPVGELCAPTSNPPPIRTANGLCEIRRSLDLLVHQGNGIEAVRLVQPTLITLLHYITGEGKDCKGRTRISHYEVAGVISDFCTQTLNCQLTDGLDMAIAFTDYLNTPDGEKLFADLNVLVRKQSVLDLLDSASLTENDLVAIARTLITAIPGADAASLRNTFQSLPLPDDVKMDLQPVVDDLVIVLNHPEIMGPVRRSLNCLSSKDTNMDTVRMLYRLGLEEQCPEFGLTRITGALQGIKEHDQRGSIPYIINVVAKAIRAEEEGAVAAAKVCRTAFSTARPAGATRSNAELAMPAVTELVEVGVINETICAADTLLFGCVGGPQPACP